MPELVDPNIIFDYWHEAFSFHLPQLNEGTVIALPGTVLHVWLDTYIDLDDAGAYCLRRMDYDEESHKWYPKDNDWIFVYYSAKIPPVTVTHVEIAADTGSHPAAMRSRFAYWAESTKNTLLLAPPLDSLTIDETDEPF
jgi:hypothetical protein